MSEIPNLINPDTGLDERETYFLEVLFDRAGGDIPYAMELAGYPKSMSPSAVRKKLSKHIKTASKEFIVSETAKAATQIVKVFQDPNAPGTKNILTAAQEILDRGDVNKTDEVVGGDEKYIVILPPKLQDTDSE
jgi:hypothetical protein